MLRNNLLYLIVISLVVTGCSKYGFVNLNYPQEPLVYLPDDVKAIAVVNRSLTKEEDKGRKVLESIITSEVGGSDRLASDECIKGVYDGIQGLHGVKMMIPKKVRIYGTGTRETPDILDWKLVAKICDSTQADALLVLETFDSNTDLLLTTATDQVTSILSGRELRPDLPRDIQMNVYSYWRLYDPDSKSIVDQYQHTFYMMFHTETSIPPPDALPQTAYAAGQEYIRRFLPSYYTVKRDMYKKAKGPAKHEFRTGFRRAEVANWDGAIEIWSNMIERVKYKTAGRACLNIAVTITVGDNRIVAGQQHPNRTSVIRIVLYAGLDALLIVHTGVIGTYPGDVNRLGRDGDDGDREAGGRYPGGRNHTRSDFFTG